ncbi:hypothetical protein [Streptomyces luteireticuli]
MTAWLIVAFLLFAGLVAAWLLHTEGVPGARQGRHRSDDQGGAR